MERRKAKEVEEMAKKIKDDPTSFKDDVVIGQNAERNNIAVIVHQVFAYSKKYEMQT